MKDKATRIQATYDVLHAMPEVGFAEHKTSAWLAEKSKLPDLQLRLVSAEQES